MNNCLSEMKVPIRPAPPPPVNQKIATSSWNGPVKDPWNKSVAAVQKKKPPPRPPPPKFNNTNKKSAPSRPSQLIADLFHRKNHVNVKASDMQITRLTGDFSESKGSNDLMLIDFNSPPSSPTLTTRSSSDALSVNSFGSDGVTQCSGSSGNASNVESGFEDDFDLFAGTSKKPEVLQPKDPWSPPLKLHESKNPFNGKGNSWVAFPSPGTSKKLSTGVSAMPTIIRSKPERYKVQPKVSNCDTGPSVELLSDVFQSTRLTSSKPAVGNSIFEEEDDDSWTSESPPMPTCPPPAPPPEVLSGLLQTVNVLEEQHERPYGIALYNYLGDQPEDLSFKKGDVINLVRRIDKNWFVGEKDGREGSVPVNFLSVRVPLPGDEDRSVTALYAFHPETWDDLGFEEGSVINVTHRIDQDWLYGECNGKLGQFPANFVDRVPSDLPLRRTG